jgi:hypothetical protein
VADVSKRRGPKPGISESDEVRSASASHVQIKDSKSLAGMAIEVL